jgi:two-component system LytT family response regulator
VRRSLTQVATQLDTRFVQVHRSAFVNVEAVREVYPRSHGEGLLVLLDGSTMMLTRTFREAFFERYRRRRGQ